MQCPACLTFNGPSATFCNQCGDKLAAGGGGVGGGRWGLRVLALVLLGGGGLGIAYFLTRDGTEQPGLPARQNPGEAPESVHAVKVPVPGPSSADPPRPPLTGPRDVRLPTGWVAIEDRWEHRITRIAASVVAGRWLALPRRAVLGGATWHFRQGQPDASLIVAGVWQPGEELGLWALEDGTELDGPELLAWDEAVDLYWSALDGSGGRRRLEAGQPESRGLFAVLPLEDGMDRAGVVTQEDAVVGWTFGSILDGIWLWTGEDGTALRHELRVEGFYDATFARGREEALAAALALGRSRPPAPSRTRLEKHAVAWQLDARLELDETPEYLAPERVLPEMVRLCVELRDTDPGAVAELVNEPVLLAAGDVNLLLATVTSLNLTRGPGPALNLALGLEADLVEEGTRSFITFRELLRALYMDWLQQHLDENALREGWSVLDAARRRFPEDAAIHLRGVELALAEGDWAEAERLIDQRTYALALADREKLLRARISELKGLEGKFAIRFRPGARIISTQARLDRRLDQRFLVDTGASMTTIPVATQERLGIPITAETPRRRVSTAGGEVTAYEVVLGSIEIGGWEINDVSVLVLDLPGQEHLGLLGLNFLRHFRMDLRTDEGLLLLEPR